VAILCAQKGKRKVVLAAARFQFTGRIRNLQLLATTFGTTISKLMARL
jgi:hypothetical protein